MKNKTFLRSALFTVFCLNLYLLGLITHTGTKEVAIKSDVAVVFGNEVFADGTPSARLAARLDRAADLYHQGLCSIIIVSGGTGKSGANEALAMQAYLRRVGIPQNRLVVDKNGRNTRETAEFTAKYMTAHTFRSVIAVSQFFHVPRSELALRQEGILSVAGAYARYFEWRDMYSIQREIFGYIAYYFYMK